MARLANQNGAKGEVHAIDSTDNWIPRPKGQELKNLLAALEKTGISIKRSSFDAISLPSSVNIDFNDSDSIESSISKLVFIEIKTANQDRVKEDFSGFFFALSESEIAAADVLGDRHKVALFNNKTGAKLITSVPEIIAKSRSTNWQVSVQL